LLASGWKKHDMDLTRIKLATLARMLSIDIESSKHALSTL
jgi:hypothetical protein